jgi:predicted TPR repeat methyltransferase
VSSDEDLRMRRDRIEEELRSKVALAERDYHAAVAEYKHHLQIHAESEDSPHVRLAIVHATQAHQTAVEKYSRALHEFNRLIMNDDLVDET